MTVTFEFYNPMTGDLIEDAITGIDFGKIPAAGMGTSRNAELANLIKVKVRGVDSSKGGILLYLQSSGGITAYDPASALPQPGAVHFVYKTAPAWAPLLPSGRYSNTADNGWKVFKATGLLPAPVNPSVLAGHILEVYDIAQAPTALVVPIVTVPLVTVTTDGADTVWTSEFVWLDIFSDTHVPGDTQGINYRVAVIAPEV